MSNAAFILLRVATATTALCGLTGTVFVILVAGAFGLLKDGFHIGLTLAHFFASGLRDRGGSTQPDPLVSLPLAGLVAVFLAMFLSVFMPERRIVLHVIAGAVFVATVWRAWLLVTVPGSSGLAFFAFALWFVYYAMCLRLIRSRPSVA